MSSVGMHSTKSNIKKEVRHYEPEEVVAKRKQSKESGESKSKYSESNYRYADIGLRSRG